VAFDQPGGGALGEGALYHQTSLCEVPATRRHDSDDGVLWVCRYEGGPIEKAVVAEGQPIEVQPKALVSSSKMPDSHDHVHDRGDITISANF
jgi:hypothetical protein